MAFTEAVKVLSSHLNSELQFWVRNPDVMDHWVEDIFSLHNTLGLGRSNHHLLSVTVGKKVLTVLRRNFESKFHNSF